MAKRPTRHNDSVSKNWYENNPGRPWGSELFLLADDNGTHTAKIWNEDGKLKSKGTKAKRLG